MDKFGESFSDVVAGCPEKPSQVEKIQLEDMCPLIIDDRTTKTPSDSNIVDGNNISRQQNDDYMLNCNNSNTPGNASLTLDYIEVNFDRMEQDQTNKIVVEIGKDTFSSLLEDSSPECDKQSNIPPTNFSVDSNEPTVCPTQINESEKPSTSYGNTVKSSNRTNYNSLQKTHSSQNKKKADKQSKKPCGFDNLNQMDFSQSNSNSFPHSNRLMDLFRSRKYHRTDSLNSHSGKRPNHFTLDKAARPFTKSSKLYKPVSASFRSKQELLANMSTTLVTSDLNRDHDTFIGSGSVRQPDIIDIHYYNNCVLPIPILVHIFSYLSLFDLLCRTALVCRYWYSAVFDPALWRYLNLYEQNNLTDEILLKLSGISDNVLGINLSTRVGSLQLFPQTIDTCLSRSTNLRILNMARCFDMPAEAFISIGIYCHNLVHLDLDICSNITNETIVSVGKGCPKLRILYLGQCSLVKNTGVVEVARGCPLLQQLRIEQCDKITDQGVIELTKYCPDIDYLHMLSCSLTDSSICQLIRLIHLRMLDISNITQLSPKVLAKVVQHCLKLEVLNVSLNRAVDDECIKTIVLSCPKLRVLSCVSCRLTDKALEYVAEFGHSVEHLDVAWCADITNYGVRRISQNNPSLRYLGLMQCRKVSFDTIDEMIETHPEIHYSNFVTETRRILKKACLTVDHEFQTMKVLC